MIYLLGIKTNLDPYSGIIAWIWPASEVEIQLGENFTNGSGGSAIKMPFRGRNDNFWGSSEFLD